MIIIIIGFVAATLTTVAFMPQALRIWRTRSAKDISGLGTTLFTFGVALWVAYGFAIHSLPIIVANAITLALNLSILWLKVRHSRECG